MAKVRVYFDDSIVFYAFRYALGRKTYAVNHVVDFLIENWNLLSGTVQETIQREIREAIEMQVPATRP